MANIYGIEYEDTYTYVELLKISTNKKLENESSYTIYIPGDGKTLEDSDDKTINSTEFENRAMEYFNSVYKEDKYTFGEEDITGPIKNITIEKKDKTDTACKLEETLTIDTSVPENFISISFISNILSGGTTKENADYVYTMKVGQTIKFDTKFSGFTTTGSSIEASDDMTEIIAIGKGISKGTLNFGNVIKKFYITVEENTNNEQLEDIIIKIDSEESKTEDTKIPTTETTSKTTTTITTKTEDIKNNSDSTTAKTELPKTGIDTIIYIIIAIVGIAVLTFIILNKKYKDIK